MDIKKAYPTVFREGLFTKLAQNGIIGDIWCTMKDMYNGLTSAVSVEGATSETYPVENGLMEGAILSPFLYTVFIDGLAKLLEKANLGCKIAGGWAGALYYADDLCLLANSPAEMQKMLYIVDQYCRDWKFQPSFKKTAVVRFGKWKQESHCCGKHNEHHTRCACNDQRRHRVGVEARPECRLFLPCMAHDTPESARPANAKDNGPRTKSNPIMTQKEYDYLGVTFTETHSFEEHVKEKVVPNIARARAQLYPFNATIINAV